MFEWKRDAAAEYDWHAGKKCVRRLRQQPVRVWARQHDQVQFTVAVFLDNKVRLRLPPLVGVKHGVQVLEVDIGPKGGVGVQGFDQ